MKQGAPPFKGALLLGYTGDTLNEVLFTLNMPDDIPHPDITRWFDQLVPSEIPPFGTDVATAFQLVENHFKKTLGNGLGLGDIGYFNSPLP